MITVFSEKLLPTSSAECCFCLATGGERIFARVGKRLRITQPAASRCARAIAEKNRNKKGDRAPQLALRHGFLKIIFALFCVILPGSVQGQIEPPPYRFHKKVDFGSHAQLNPYWVLLNMGYDITQLDRYRNDILTYPYASAASNVFGNLARPLPIINKYGWGRFVRHEILPLEFSAGASWWPNYQLHLVGGGACWARLTEWYDDHGFPAPGWLAGGTVMAGHLLNEVMENNNVKGRLIDPIADIYIFDLGGILLFSSESVRRFFGEDLQLSDWSLQPTLVFPDIALQNAGQYFSVKLKVPGLDNWSLLYVFGLNGLLGVSHNLDETNAVSLAGGLRTRELYPETENPLHFTADLTWSAGAFWDRQGSLLTSLVFSGISSNFVTLNIYPGVFELGSISHGLWLSMSNEGRVMGGLILVWDIGLGW